MTALQRDSQPCGRRAIVRVRYNIWRRWSAAFLQIPPRQAPRPCFTFRPETSLPYLAESRRWATLINASPQLERLGREQAAHDAGGTDATVRLMSASPGLSTPFWHGGNLSAAIAAAKLGDRSVLRARLKAAAEGQENWRDLAFPAASFERWRNDAELKPLLDAVFDRTG